MQGDFPYRSVERALGTVDAAKVLLDNMQAILQQCLLTGDDEVALALVQPDLTFGGVQTVPLSTLRDVVFSLDPAGWHMTFSRGSTPGEIERRCEDMAGLAKQRAALLTRMQEKEGK